MDSRDRSIGTALTRDFRFSGDATFVADLVSGDYEATVTLGDASYGHDRMGVYLEGVQVDELTTSAGAFVTRTYAVHVADGQLTLRLRDMGGRDLFVTINALEVAAMAVENQPPTVDAGENQAITLPTNEAALDGTVMVWFSPASTTGAWFSGAGFTAIVTSS